jgi:hypothetical protein
MSLTLEERVALLETQLEEYNRYIPYVYTQKTTDAAGVFNVAIPTVRQIPEQLLFYTAVKRSVSGTNNLVIKQSGLPDLTLQIMYEDNRGTVEPIPQNGITPNKVCIFRLQKVIGRAILINANIEDTALVRDLTVSNNLLLNKKPILEGDELITLSQLNIKLGLDIPAIINDYVIVGTESELDALADAPDGAVYFKVGDDV